MNYALVLAAHGSSMNSTANECIFRAADRIQQQTRIPHVTPAFVKGTPSLGSVAHEIGPAHLIVLPWMTSFGYFSDVVLRRELVGTTDQTVSYFSPIGAEPGVAEIVENRVNYLMQLHGVSEQETQVVVVGHGTRRHRRSCLSTIQLVRRLQERNHHLRFDFAFIDQNPELEYVASKQSRANMIVIPFLMSEATHGLVDVPNAVGLDGGSTVDFPIVGGHGNRRIVDRPIGMLPEMVDLAVDILRQSGIASPENSSGRFVGRQREGAFQ